MKSNLITLCLGLILAQPTFACIIKNNTAICVGDTVYKGSDYSKGALVMGVNEHSGIVTVQSINSGDLFKESASALYFSRGCVNGFCVGDTIYKNFKYSKGAIVVGVNDYKNELTVRSINNEDLLKESASDLFSSRGCMSGICAGDIVYKGSTYSRGALVAGVNYTNGKIMVQSINSESFFVENAADLTVNTMNPNYSYESRNPGAIPSQSNNVSDKYYQLSNKGNCKLMINGEYSNRNVDNEYCQGALNENDVVSYQLSSKGNCKLMINGDYSNHNVDVRFCR